MNDSPDNLEVDFERINILYGNARYGYFGVVAGILFFGYIIWQLAEVFYAIMWVLAVVISYLPRSILSYIFVRKSARLEIVPQNVRKWETYFIYTSILPFLCFSTAVFIPYGENSFDAILYYAVIVMTLLSGGILSYSTSLPAIFLYMNLTIVPLIFKCFWMQDPMFIALGLTLAFGYLLLGRLIPRLNKLLLENITLKLENQHHSLTDPLTNLGNRRRLQLRIEDLIPVSRRRGEPFSIILIDLDQFKNYNDTHGHSAGDKLLIKVANILNECSRDQDLVVRYGGEEFLIVLPSSDLEDAIVLTERIRNAIKDKAEITISAGLATHVEDQDFDKLVRRADESLYRAKAAGSDRYELATIE